MNKRAVKQLHWPQLKTSSWSCDQQSRPLEAKIPRMDVVITEFAALVVNFQIQSAVSGLSALFI